MNFDQAFERLIGHEGAFQNDPRDRGNWTSGVRGKGALKGTKFGITAMEYPAEDIEQLTLERAKELYRRDYWGAAGCDAVPDAVKFDVFDTAVNSGRGTAIRLLQKACGAHVDGLLGPQTLQMLQAMPPLRLTARFNGARLMFLTEVDTWTTYGRGWARRVAANLLEA